MCHFNGTLMPIYWHKIANEVAHTIFKLYGLFFQYRPQYEPETFFKRGFPVLGSHAFVQIVYYREAGIVQRVCLFHDADAPVKVGGEAVLQVIRFY